MYATWKAHAEASGKEIYTPGREKSAGVPRGSLTEASGTASARSNPAALKAPGLADGMPEQEVLWNPVQAKFELMELSHRKQTLQQRLNAINRRSAFQGLRSGGTSCARHSRRLGFMVVRFVLMRLVVVRCVRWVERFGDVRGLRFERVLAPWSSAAQGCAVCAPVLSSAATLCALDVC